MKAAHAAHAFEPHLVVNEIRLPRSAEWLPQMRGWSFIQIRSGISYWQQPEKARELGAGSVLVLTGEAQGELRASQLNEVQISYFSLEPEKLSGLLSLSEQQSLMKVASGQRSDARVLTPSDPLADRFKTLCLNKNGANLSMRVQLLQLFIDLFKGELEAGTPDAPQELDGRARLRQFLKQTAASEFLDLSLADLAPKMHCSPRHLSRLFRQEIGASFRDKQTDLRLGKACQLLATSNAKVIDVALASGYKSNSLFSLMFKKHFGLSPGKWRLQQKQKPPARPRVVRSLPV